MTSAPVRLLVEHAHELVTLSGPVGPRRGAAQGSLETIQDGAVAIGQDGRVVAVGPTQSVCRAVAIGPRTHIVDASGRAVLPGFVDAHTHLVFAGDRVEEFAERLAGADYLEILAAGGGILNTVRATTTASPSELVARSVRWVEAMLAQGTTTIEIKSGYGLSLDTERKAAPHRG